MISQGHSLICFLLYQWNTHYLVWFVKKILFLPPWQITYSQSTVTIDSITKDFAKQASVDHGAVTHRAEAEHDDWMVHVNM
jgi:hypothetical protein